MREPNHNSAGFGIREGMVFRGISGRFNITVGYMVRLIETVTDTLGNRKLNNLNKLKKLVKLAKLSVDRGFRLFDNKKGAYAPIQFYQFFSFLGVPLPFNIHPSSSGKHEHSCPERQHARIAYLGCFCRYGRATPL